MTRYAVVMDKWLEVYAQHARTDVPVLPTKAHLPSGRFGSIAFPKKYPGLRDSVRDCAEDQADRVKAAEASPEVRDGKTLYWVQGWPLNIEQIWVSEEGVEKYTIRAWRVSINGLALWLTPDEVECFKRDEWPWGKETICQRVDKWHACRREDYFPSAESAAAMKAIDEQGVRRNIGGLDVIDASKVKFK